ncbi:hypothetical protein TELCIR_19723 [Teladorsagia circumcincta]|uniref:Uncharacterized protein n=1 Tax=Teladorsagia circumcincta TaxID=45464 RepID=A0A2G9TLH5_TELCI|nr:hypothetical protein TELCIR_19723 [Teladorsagia circumcincta]
MSDRSSAKGIRRILALTGERARENRHYARAVLARLESEYEDLNRENQINRSSEEKIEWARIPYVEGARCRELLKSIKKKRKTKKAVIAA